MTVFSTRLDKRDPLLFRGYDAYRDFLRFNRDRRREKTGPIYVSTDAKDFFPSISVAGVESALSRCVRDEATARYALDLFRFWATDSERGLPIGPLGSRVLAEAFLIDSDAAMMKVGVRFARYCDDYRMYAPSEAAAVE
jgi:hypothetical protein